MSADSRGDRVNREGSRLTIPEEAARKILLAMNPVIEYPGSSQIQRARRLRTHVETRGWAQTGKAVRMWVELVAGLEAAVPLAVAAELERVADEIGGDLAPPPHPYWVERHDDGALTAEMVRQVDRIEARAAELRGGAQ